MYKVAFEKNAAKEFLKLHKDARELIAAKIIDLKNGNFSKDKQLRVRSEISSQFWRLDLG